MPGRLTTISTGSAIRRANERFNKASWAELKLYLDAIEARSSVDEAARVHGPLETVGQIDHHNEFIGNGPGAFFPQFDTQLKNDIMRISIIQALRLALYKTFRDDGSVDVARDKPLPIVTYWICGAETYEAYVDLSVAEVHIFLVTPNPVPALAPPHEDEASEELMWLCAAPERVQEIRSRAPGYTYRDPVAMPSGLKSLCQQVKSY